MFFYSFQGKTKLYFSTMTEIYDKLAPIVGPKSILRDEVIDEIEMEDVMEGRSVENKQADVKREIISKSVVNATVSELKEETTLTAVSEIKEENKATTVSDIKQENKTTVVSEPQEVKKKESTIEVPKICEGDSKSQNKTCGKSSSQDTKPVIVTVQETEKPKSQSEVVEMVIEEDKKEGANPPAVETQQVGSPRASRSREVKPEEKKLGKK